MMLRNDEHVYKPMFCSLCQAETSMTDTVVEDVPEVVDSRVKTKVAVGGLESLIVNEPHEEVDYVRNVKSKSICNHITKTAGIIIDTLGSAVPTIQNNTRNPYTNMGEEFELHIIRKKNNLSRQDNISVENPLYDRMLQDESKNSIQQLAYENFYHQNKHYDPLYEKEKIELFQNSGEILLYQMPVYLNELNIKSLRDHLHYLSDELRLVIEKNDFRTINTTNNDHVSCTIAGVLRIDIDTLHINVIQPHKLPNRMPASSTLLDCLHKMKKSKHIDFFNSFTYKDILGLNSYFMTDGKKYDNQGFILDMHKEDGSGSHSVGIKFKIVNNKPQLLLIDYQKHGLKLPNLPNPDRFIPFIDKAYTKFTIYRISILKPIMLLNRPLPHRIGVNVPL